MEDTSTDRYSTSITSGVLEASSFIGACLVGWVVFPMLLLTGAVMLLGYACAAELLSSLLAAPAPPDTEAPRETAERLCRNP